MSDSYIPEFFADSREIPLKVKNLLENGISLIDLVSSQSKELSKIKMRSDSNSQVQAVFVHYPWLNSVLKILGEKEFIEVRTARNRYKITQEEQANLSSKKVGVVGLSVGRTISMTIAMERSCGLLRLADFDTLELSNLNRIKAPLTHLGLKKTVSLAREIKELDPFFNLEIFNDGITSENIDAFFNPKQPLDLLIDECDSLEMKIKLRQKARTLRIPVIMDTSDRGLVDIERFDLEPDRPFFHGRIGDFDPPDTWQISDTEKQTLFAQIIDLDNISQRGLYSLSEMGKTISSWPQLSSDVVTGGGVSAQIARKILLGENVPSGRYYFDVESWLKNGDRK